jgi:hypothetical protein
LGIFRQSQVEYQDARLECHEGRILQMNVSWALVVMMAGE